MQFMKQHSETGNALKKQLMKASLESNKKKKKILLINSLMFLIKETNNVK